MYQTFDKHAKAKSDALKNGTIIHRKKNNIIEIMNLHCGFSAKRLIKKQFTIYQKINTNYYLSLALYDYDLPFLRAYANKLPIMAINASRLEYTYQAFQLKRNTQSIEQKALEFYVNYEISNINFEHAPNKRFSKLLHSLKSDGSEDYIFALAKHLQLHVDLIKNEKFVFRYQFNNYNKQKNNSNQNINTLIPISNPIPMYISNYNDSKANGVITAVFLFNKWHVSVTSSFNPIVSDDGTKW